jgi:hypothetical protein
MIEQINEQMRSVFEKPDRAEFVKIDPFRALANMARLSCGLLSITALLHGKGGLHLSETYLYTTDRRFPSAFPLRSTWAIHGTELSRLLGV